jgi:uncharacterized protein
VVDELYDVRDDGTIELRVHAQPGAGRSQVRGRHGDALKVSVGAPPEKGLANAAIAKLLATTFGAKPKDISIVGGETNREKRYVLKGLDPDAFRQALEREVSGGGTGSVPRS